MQSSGGSRSSSQVRYYRRAPEESEATDAERQESSNEEPYEEPEVHPSPAIAPAATATVNGSSSRGSGNAVRWPFRLSSVLSDLNSLLRDNPVVVSRVAAGLAATGGVLLALSVVTRRNKQQAAAAGHKDKATAAHSAPGPNSRVKPTHSCVPVADGSVVVVHRPIAADNSCLFNAVGYCMHHSTNRAPFLRQVVSREVSSDPQHYSAAFLGMDNAAYCAWITNPAHWGGGIELSILASHYRREIAAWNLATGACHVFGEDAGYTKRVMVMYNGVHYDALAVSPSPKAAKDEDVTEFNPRTKRGKLLMAAAQKLVALQRQGKEGHHEKQDKQKQAAKQQRKLKKQQQAAGQSQTDHQQAAEQTHDDKHDDKQQGSGEPITDKQQVVSTASPSQQELDTSDSVPFAAGAAAAAPAGPLEGKDSNGSNGSSNTVYPADDQLSVQPGEQRLGCQSCGEKLPSIEAARAHAAATGHVEFAEL